MLSPYKLYKYDRVLAHTPDPAGKAICTRHYNVDWTVHRLLPAVVGRRNSLAQKGVGKVVAPISQRTKNGRRTAAPERFKQDPAQVFADSSPRWGARGERPVAGETVPFPARGQAEVSKKTKAAALTTAGVGGAGVKHNELEQYFNSGYRRSHPKYKSKIKKGSYTQYKY